MNHPYDPKHYRFVRNSGFKKSDFEDNKDVPGDKLVLFTALVIFLILLVAEVI